MLKDFTVTPARKEGLEDAGLGPLSTRYWALTLHFTLITKIRLNKSAKLNTP